MGIRQLEKFMKETVPNGYFAVSIIELCQRFEETKNIRPTLVIDLMGLINFLCNDNVTMLCGGRHDLYRTILEEFLRQLSEVGKLVFFEDGPTMSGKFETIVRRQNEKYDLIMEIYDKVYSRVPLQEIVNSYKDIPSITTHLAMIENVAKTFGELIVTATKECDAELVQYANSDPSVLAVIADDSDFLIFSGNWRYWSLRNIDMTTLFTFEYNKSALRNFLQLNDDQLKILSTLGGNDIIQFDDLRQFHQSYGLYGAHKFVGIANLIRQNLNMPLESSNLVQVIAFQVLRDGRQETMDRIRSSLDQYNTDFELPNFCSDALLSHCRDNYCDFTFSILQHNPKNFTLSYYDLRYYQTPNLFAATKELFCKQIGIVLQHDRENSDAYEVLAKRTHDESYLKYHWQKECPSQVLPPLINLLKREEFKEHDDLRFYLLKWMIGDAKLIPINLSKIPKNYLLDILVLVLMTSKNFISTVEADLILLSIKHVELKMIPKNLPVPNIVHERAFHLSFLFTKFYMTVDRCLEVAGLKESMTKLLNFDGVFFHHQYLKFLTTNFNPKLLLTDLEPFRIYE